MTSRFVLGITGNPVTTVTILQGSTGNRSYTANWSRTDYSITCQQNGGNATNNPTSYHIESDSITLSNPTRTGYVFKGWMGTGLE